VREALRSWFEAAARPLPWRVGTGAASRDPYRTLVIETMAQQTRIETVVAREPDFLARFPDLATLAAAELDDVLHAWSGLGYYRRARALHALARTVVEEHEGRLPADPAALRRLPGIGAYTAAAIAAQAFGVPGVAVDGNVRRVGARVAADADATDADVAATLSGLLLEGAVAPADAFVAEALVELGATVCTPRRPACGACPLRPVCRAAARGEPERYPTPRRRAAARPWPLHAWLTTRAGPSGPLLALERRPDTGPWAGLHGPPWRAHAPVGGRELGRFVHRLSHRLVEATVWAAPAPPADAHVRWSAAPEWHGLGMAEVDRRALAWARAADAEADAPPRG
jgi:A/G-specific adenine glycosylase